MGKFRRQRGVRRRFARVAKIFFKMFIAFSREYHLVRTKGYAYALQKMRRSHQKNASELYAAAVGMGGVLIKLCQYFSTRRDVFPEEYIKTLSPLQDSVPPLAFAEIETVLKSEYGDYARAFAWIDEDPLASASLGQVHRVRLHDGREAVAKILKPGIEKIIDTDFAILHFVFRFLSRFRVFREHADFFDILSEFIRVTGDELNFRREIYIAKRFRQDLARFDYVDVPEIYDDLCTDRVIVMEFLAGDRINNMDSWMTRNNDPRIIASRVIELYMEQFLSLSFVHFDPHPGNILVEDGNRIALVDFGMAGEISERMRSGLADFLQAMIRKDPRKMIDTLSSLGFIRKNANRYTLVPIADFFIDRLMETIRFDRESFYTIDFTPIRDDLVEIIYTQPFTIPIEWAYIGKTLSSIAGLISQLDPEFNLYGELKSYAGRFLSSGVADRAEALLGSLKTNLSTAAVMPVRISDFMNDFETGYFKIKVDYGEIIDKIDEVKGFVKRLLCFLVALVSGVSAFVFYWQGRTNESLLFVVLSAVSFVVFLIYKKKSIKDRIRKYF